MMPADRGQPVRAVARDYPDGALVGAHCHAEGQFIHATTGVMEIRAARHLWLVPPQRALWVPPRLPHTLRARGAVSLRTLYIAAPDTDRLSDAPRGFRMSRLVRELILRMLDPEIDDTARYDRLVGVLLDELDDLASSAAAIILPADVRLARACADIIAAPGQAHRVDALAHRAGASIRTLTRLARDELGCPLSTWRQQARVMAAIPMLIEGQPITNVAHDLGYKTPGAFAAMFKRFVGVTPSRYRADAAQSG